MTNTILASLEASDYPRFSDFIRDKAFEQSISMKQLADKAGVERTKIYKLTAKKWIQEKELRELLCNILEFSEDDMQLSEEILRIGAIEPERRESWKAITAHLHRPASPAINFDVSFYEKSSESVNVSANKLLWTIFSDQDSEFFEIKVVNCVNARVFSKLAYIFEVVSRAKKQVETIHFSEVFASPPCKYIDSIMSLTTKLPILRIGSYSLYLSAISQHSNAYAKDSVLISAWKKNSPNTAYWFSLSDKSMCVKSSELQMHSFLNALFSSIRLNKERPVLQTSKPFSNLGAIDSQEDSLLFCKHPQFNLMPPTILNSYRDRVLKSGAIASSDEPANEPIGMKAFCSRVDSAIGSRESVSRRRNTCVMSMGSLHNFASSGVPAHGYPPLSREETKCALTDLMNRSNDESDPFKLVVTRSPLFENRLQMQVFAGGRICIEDADSNSAAFFDDKALSYAMLDCLDNWLIPKRSLGIEASNAYISMLVNDYLL
ncbi:MAG: hypothetical protein LBU32_25430 [Clostridiales bacterium]|jgi:transcriptional regulator with XRE-family HTH domain|nr:hypothetical protein [Clostridiales bacterium]